MELNLSGNQFEEMACVYIGNALSIIIYIIVETKDLYCETRSKRSVEVYRVEIWNTPHTQIVTDIID